MTFPTGQKLVESMMFPSHLKKNVYVMMLNQPIGFSKSQQKGISFFSPPNFEPKSNDIVNCFVDFAIVDKWVTCTDRTHGNIFPYALIMQTHLFFIVTRHQ